MAPKGPLRTARKIVVDIFDSQTKQLFGVARKAPISAITPRRIPRAWPKIWPTCSSAFLHHAEKGYRLPRQMRVEGG
jgi:hypothetical protein